MKYYIDFHLYVFLYASFTDHFSDILFELTQNAIKLKSNNKKRIEENKDQLLVSILETVFHWNEIIQSIKC